MGAKNLDTNYAELLERIKKLEQSLPEDKTTLLLLDNSFDKALAAFNIANSSAASGMDTTVFVTFWGVSAFRKSASSKKNFIERMFGWMLPTGTKQLSLSRMNMGGMGTFIMKGLMKKHRAPLLDESLELAADLGVKIILCEMTMELMGIKRSEIISYPHLEYGGATTFVENCSSGKITLALT